MDGKLHYEYYINSICYKFQGRDRRCLKFSTSNSNFNAFNSQKFTAKKLPCAQAAYFAKLSIIV